MKKILVTGCTGMLGSDLVRTFKATGKYDVYGLSRSRSSLLPNSHQIVVDLTSKSYEVRLPWTPDVIIHTAAITDLNLCEQHPQLAHLVNVQGSKAIANLAGKQTTLYYISTDSVFDGQKGGYSETDSPNPLNVYGHTKLAGESAAREGNTQHLSVIRTNIYGFHSPLKSSLAEWAYREWRDGKTITGFTDTVFNAVFINQLSIIIQFMINQEILFPILNIGSNTAISKYDFLDKFSKVLGSQREKLLKKAESTDFPARVKRPLNTSLDTHLLSTFCKVPDFDSGLHAWISSAEEQGVLKT